eukprot:c14029_g1_i2.p1 GENE.c14029_g1_i2~~c14029_g1_i2.p1  ORF type:complete len:233 (+),score=112.01 c14029_g1_i2:23-700(+)
MFARVARSCHSASSVVSKRSLTAATLPTLPYDFGALEPHISASIMEIHYLKHHQAYVTNLNVALEQEAEASSKGQLDKQITLQTAIKFNGGGHINHSIFWTNLAPAGRGGGGEPTGEVGKLITSTWGSFSNFQQKFNTQAASVQGSGWAWLVFNKATGRIEITTRPNQDPVSTDPNQIPLLGVDVWEHAYYLQYKNVRPDYLKAIWNVVNWSNVSERLAAASAAK